MLLQLDPAQSEPIWAAVREGVMDMDEAISNVDVFIRVNGEQAEKADQDPLDHLRDELRGLGLKAADARPIFRAVEQGRLSIADALQRGE
jgi:hypothetical protein